MICKYSLIIPVYQVREYIEECLESIFCQIPEDVQVILVDDGSTDGSGEICDEYAKKYHQIEVIHQENKGVAAARNVGLDAAKGEYLLWVDPDDRVKQEWYNRIDRAIQTYQPDLVVFDSVRFSEKKYKKECYGREKGWIEKGLFVKDVARDIRMFSGMPNKVFRRACFQSVRFNTQLLILEDYAIIPDVMKNVETIWYENEILYEYRQRATSIVHSYAPEKSLKCIETAFVRREAFSGEYRQAADVGIAVQMLMFCRADGYDKRYRLYRQQQRMCQRFIKDHLMQFFMDNELPIKWKIKLVLVSIGILSHIVRIKYLILGYERD